MLLSASAGFGRTTLFSEWIATCGSPVAWLSLDERVSDPVGFITHLMAALQIIKAGSGESLLLARQSHQPPQMHLVIDRHARKPVPATGLPAQTVPIEYCEQLVFWLELIPMSRPSDTCSAFHNLRV